MKRNKRVLIKYLALMLILVSALLLSACRTRITNNNEVSNVHYDEGGYLSETYQMHRDELGLSTAKKPLLPDFGPVEDEQEDYSNAEPIDYEPEPEEPYVEPPEARDNNNPTNTTTDRNTRRSRNRRSGSGNTSNERVTITFDPNGGKCDKASKEINKGSKIGSLPKATKDDGTTNKRKWTTAKNGGSQVTSDTIINEDVTIYAYWDAPEEPVKVTVTFDAQGGTCSEKTRSVEKGKAIGELPTATKDKKDFVGWSTSKNGSIIDSSYKVAQNVTLFAKWKDPKKKEYEIVFDANGGKVNPEKKKVIEGESYGDLPTPTYKGHRFEGWFIGDVQVKSSDKPTKGETLTAHWLDWDGDDGFFAEILADLEDSEQNYILADNAPEGSQLFVDTCKGKIDPDDYDYVIQFAEDPKAEGEALANSGNYKGKTVIVLPKYVLGDEADKYDRILYQTVLINDLHGGFDDKVSEAVKDIGAYNRYNKKMPK